MKNYVQDGEVVTLTAPSGGVVSGLGYKIGSLIVIATGTVAQTLPFSALTTGVVDVVKKAGSAWTEGEKIYWDDGEKNFQDDGSGNTLVGVAAAAAASEAVVGKVRLDGVAR